MWIVKLIEAIVRLIANRADPENRKRDHAEKTEKKVKKAIAASRKKDAAEVNRILMSKWFKSVTVFIGLSISLAGCQGPVVIVPKAEAVYPMEREGVPGWFVPQPIFERMLEAVVRQQEKEN
jgi:hypothetical protein